jgi:hypothetical protein
MTEVETPAREGDTERLELSLRFWTLPPFLRVLPITDGTVTQSLEAYFADPIEVVVLSHCESVSHRKTLAIVGESPRSRYDREAWQSPRFDT